MGINLKERFRRGRHQWSRRRRWSTGECWVCCSRVGKDWHIRSTAEYRAPETAETNRKAQSNHRKRPSETSQFGGVWPLKSLKYTLNTLSHFCHVQASYALLENDPEILLEASNYLIYSRYFPSFQIIRFLSFKTSI